MVAWMRDSVWVPVIEWYYCHPKLLCAVRPRWSAIYRVASDRLYRCRTVSAAKPLSYSCLRQCTRESLDVVARHRTSWSPWLKKRTETFSFEECVNAARFAGLLMCLIPYDTYALVFVCVCLSTANMLYCCAVSGLQPPFMRLSAACTRMLTLFQ